MRMAGVRRAGTNSQIMGSFQDLTAPAVPEKTAEQQVFIMKQSGISSLASADAERAGPGALLFLFSSSSSPRTDRETPSTLYGAELRLACLPRPKQQP